ncbi:NAK protein kinase [Microbotryum lychnidis-dioicae p1A1 Lamole]|uniref:non-specific serine/threonine protein kinase n=1 Tax=Microbotryum lychnidis-dioicae (strain p1A1 Lamole / MvSl-1064) TaxID=683840 RepID=U5H535_USTV1|nr:NAK protein kinase [Microbotryum lychnidis-dioicae p1A1 Lamole]|eukprot:KDE07373.1 NAK protein kinase [Microbotryum lychnidis-dioicae p1A1 Lamole]
MAAYQPPSLFASTSNRSSYVPRAVVAPATSAHPHAGGGLPQFVPPTQASNVPPGTLPPGTIVRVGEYEVKVDRFLSEGGFAHVYLATSASPIPAGSSNATTKHVLKRMAVPDTKGVHEVGKEVQVMKLVRNHPKIVNIIEASVADLPGGTNGSKGYEIYILMEWCAGGGIIDLMNTRLQNRLTETEILKIFSDTVEAVAHMHYQDPPLIHRDLKVENILLSPPQTFKLCDFGSTTKPLPKDKVPTAVEGLQALELEINTTTTLQYRAPELVDVWSRKGFDEKIDIWALGVFLYKLCYYTTPFEEHGPLAILSAQYKIPHYPAYSNSIKGLIGGLLQESVAARPNIYQVHEQVCRLRGTAVRLENKYAKSSRPPSTKPSANLGFASVMSSSPAAPNPSGPNLAETISPMRRGRPTKTGGTVAALAKNAEERSTPPSDSPAPKNLGHEWDPVGITSNGDKASSSGDANGFGDSFTSIGANGSSSGFGDSFQPTSPSAAEMSPALTPSFSSTAISKPSEASSAKSPTSPPPIGLKSPLLASAEAVLNDQSWRTRPVSSTSARNLPTSPASTVTGTKAVEAPVAAVDERERFESTYPDLDGLESFTSSGTKVASLSKNGAYSSASPAGSVTSPPPTATSAQLTGEGDTGPPLPRRPPTSSNQNAPTTSLKPSGSIRMQNRPDFTSRSSQTSLHLGNDRPLSGPKAMMNKPKEATNDLGRDPIALPGMARVGGPRPTSFSTGGSGSSFSSRWTPTAQSSTPVVASPKQAPVDLLGDDEDNDDAFAPKPLHRPSATATLTPNATESLNLPPTSSSTGTNRTSIIASSDFNFEASREKFRPVKPADSPSASRPTFSSQASPNQRAETVAPTSKPKAATKDDLSTVEQRFPEAEAIGSTGPHSVANEPKEEETWQKIEEKEDESSDDEVEQVEDITIRPRLSGPRMPNERTYSSQSFKKEEEKKVVNDIEPAADQVVSPTSGYPVLPPITRMDSTSTDGGGDIDLAPALASILKFAPVAPPKPNIPKPDFNEKEGRSAASSSSSATRSGPPILAPRPQSVNKQDQINNLVSRYEGLSSSSDPGNRKPLPPVPAGKPTTLRQTSASSGKGRPAFGAKKASQAAVPTTTEETAPPHWSSKQASIGNFSSRFPNAEGLHKHLTGETTLNPATTATRPSTPPRSYASPSSAVNISTPSSPAFSNGTTTASGSTRPPPFKPVPPTSGPSTPQRSYALPPSSQTTAPNKPSDGEEEEERFAGVSSMKSRWESITREQSRDGGGAGSKGPGKVEKRKSWAVV